MKLILPTRDYLASYAEAAEEYRRHGVTSYAFMDATTGDLIERIEGERQGLGLPEGWVPCTYLWLVEGQDFIGQIAIRHHLTESLRRFGGHIGYGVRYSHWNRGCGTAMLAMALVYAREEVGLSRALITCNDDNIGSARVIEKNGGILQDKIDNVIGGKPILTRRYWIELLAPPNPN